VDIRRDVALASTRADVWLEPTLSYTSNRRLLVRHSLRRDRGDEEVALAIDGSHRTNFFYGRTCATTAPHFTFQTLLGMTITRYLGPF